MLARALPILAFSCAVASAHAHHHHVVARQPTPTTTSGPSSTVTAAPGASASDAVPLDKIVPVAIQPADSITIPVATPTPGSKPANLASAPALPNLSNWATLQAGYPSADPTVPLDLNHALVKQWIQDVQNSGVAIPDYAPHAYTNDGDVCGLPENVARNANFEKEGWWSCGHYTRSTDIVECKTPKTWGSSMDDGPSDNTGKLLAWLKKENLSTTFFAVGTAVYWRPWNLQAEYIAGHQIAVHTWNHHPLTNLSTPEIIANIGWSKKIIKDVLGVTPLYMRPPYGDMDDRVRAIALAMDLTPVMWTVTGDINHPMPFDTFDWRVPGGTVTAVQSVSQFETLLLQADQYNKGFIVLSHDLYWQEVDLAIGYFIPNALAHGYKIVPIYECTGQKLINAYLETREGDALPGGSTGSATTTPGGPTNSTGSTGNNNTGSTGNNNNTGGTGNNTDNTGGGGGDSALPMTDAARVVAAVFFAGVMAVAASL